jgi:hypothetical protein
MFPESRRINYLPVLAFPLWQGHSFDMATETLTLPLATDFVGHLERRLVNELSAEATEWSECATALTRWEDENLLEAPTAESLQRHKATVERLLRLGRLISLAVRHPDFPDRSIAEMVAATEQMLKDKFTMWHGQMGSERKEEILQAVFP